MSNWSVVILGWSGVDDQVVDHDQRFRQVIEAYARATGKQRPGEQHEGWRLHHPCDDPRSIGPACEFIAIGHENHFFSSHMLEALGSFRWECPEEVVLLYKDENMDRYRQISIVEWSEGPMSAEGFPAREYIG